MLSACFSGFSGFPGFRVFRPSEVDTLLGNPTKAKKNLKWKPKIKIKQLVNEMVNEDLKILTNNDKKKN